MTQLAVTFITPHQHATSGGAQEIQAFARHLAAHARVTLAVTKGPFEAVDGVEVREVPVLAAEALPDADVLIAFAGLPAIDHLYALPASRGVPVLWFAGHHPFVRENLMRARRALALAPWLVAEAQALGCHATYVERAIDRELWSSGPPQSQRKLIVAMMVHRVEAKGTADGIAALKQVHERFPAAEIHLFGAGRDGAGFPVHRHGPIEPRQVADLLREAAVFVWPSWAEGFGLPGMEALACGAALATTDTKGSRGYAQNGQTALVTPPRQPELLAASVLSLLEDAALRQRLADAGVAHVRDAYLTWPEAAERLADTLRGIAEAASIWRPRPPAESDHRRFREPLGPSSYLRLLKASLTGAVHQEVHAVLRQPEQVLDAGALEALKAHNLVVARRQDGAERDAQVEEGREWPVAAETMIGAKRLGHLHQLLLEVTRLGIPGDLIEAGVWRGGASIFMLGFLAAYGITDRRVWVADSFEGLPKPDAERYPADEGDRHHEVPYLSVDMETVRQNFRRYGVLDDRVKFLKGWFKDTLPGLKDETWAIIRLDGDMYESTMDGLTNLYPSLSGGGFVVIDDYGAIPGAAKAVEDFRAANGIDEPLRTIDWTGVFWRKVQD